MANFTYDRFSKAHILCNNAGVGTIGSMHQLTLKDWELVLGFNLYGVIYGVNAFLPKMLQQQESCHIVNTASLAGVIPVGESPYTVSKYGVIALSERLSLENFNTNVGVSVLIPEHVDTNIVETSIAL